jgi:hypothetical protein
MTSEFIEELLKIKIMDSKLPGYHFLLSKTGIQIMDENHIKVDL